jgi:hypothetical protein
MYASREERRRKTNMGTTVADPSEPNAPAQKMQLKAEQQPPPEHLVDKFAQARRAKKKEKRARHRAKLRRPHTKG